MNNNELQKVIVLLQTEKPREAEEVFLKIQAEDTVEYFLTAGKLQQKFQRWGAAINAYSKVIELDPENKTAKNNLDLIKNILNFWSPDMFNP